MMIEQVPDKKFARWFSCRPSFLLFQGGLTKLFVRKAALQNVYMAMVFELFFDSEVVQQTVVIKTVPDDMKSRAQNVYMCKNTRLSIYVVQRYAKAHRLRSRVH